MEIQPTPCGVGFALGRAAAMVLLAGSTALAGHAVEGQLVPRVQVASVEQQIRQASDEWFSALMRLDVATLDRLQTDDFLTIQRTPSGIAVVGKAQLLENLRKADADRPRFERTLAAVKVRQYGHVAVLTGLATFRGQVDGKPVVNQAVISEVWVSEGGQWRLAHFQPTDMPTPQPKPSPQPR